MTKLIFYALICVAAFYGYRAFKREAQRVSKRAHRAQQERRNQSKGTLVQDKKTGEYYVDRD